MLTLLSRMTKHTGRKWRSLGESGVAVIEFALTAPLLVLLLMGVSDLAPTLMMKFKIANATQAVADLATQTATLQTSDVANYFAIGSDVLAPFSGATLVIRLTNVASDGNGNAFVYWSCGQGSMQPFAARAPVTATSSPALVSSIITLTKMGLNTSYVMAETQYTYSAPAKYILRSPIITNTIAYTFPRVSTYIGKGTADPLYVPPAPTATRSSSAATVGNISCNFAI